MHRKGSICIKNKHFLSGNIPTSDLQHLNTPASPLIPTARGRKRLRILGMYMVYDKLFFPKWPKFEYVRRGKPEK